MNMKNLDVFIADGEWNVLIFVKDKDGDWTVAAVSQKVVDVRELKLLDTFNDTGLHWGEDGDIAFSNEDSDEVLNEKFGTFEKALNLERGYGLTVLEYGLLAIYQAAVKAALAAKSNN